MGKAAAHCSIDLLFDVVFNPADRWRSVIYQRVGSSGISVKGLTDAPCIQHSQSPNCAHERPVNVTIDGNRLPKLGVCRFELFIVNLGIQSYYAANGVYPPGPTIAEMGQQLVDAKFLPLLPGYTLPIYTANYDPTYDPSTGVYSAACPT